jgi:hypothetical protein
MGGRHGGAGEIRQVRRRFVGGVRFDTAPSHAVHPIAAVQSDYSFGRGARGEGAAGANASWAA